MILAAADYAEDVPDSSPPPDLRLMQHCHQFPGALPEPGGLRDQPAGLLTRMRYLDGVYRVLRSLHEAKSRSKWAERNPDGWKLKLAIDKLRRQDA